MIERKRTARIITASLIAVLAVLFVWFLLPKLFVLILPFIFAFIIAKIIEPLVNFLEKKLRINRKIASAVTVIVVVGLLIWIVTYLLLLVADEVSSLITNAEWIARQITETIKNFNAFLSEHLGSKVMDFVYENLDLNSLGSRATQFLTAKIGPLISGVYSAAKSVPNVLIFIIVLIMGTYFISNDNKKITKKMSGMIPAKLSVYTNEAKKGMSNALLGYVRAQIILMGVTFCELLIGFLLIGRGIAPYALVLAFSICIIDMFPILGTGTVLIPWSLYELLTKNYSVAVYLILIYLTCLLVRQMLEPRIVSQQIGLHPLVTLMTMYAGLKLIGIIGMILGPVLALVIKNLADIGIFRDLWVYIWYGSPNTYKNDDK